MSLTDRNRAIVEAYVAGMKLQRIADKHGITRQRVEQIARESRAPLRSPNRSHNRTDAATALLADIESWCSRTGTPETSIGHLLFLHPGFVGLLRKRLTVSEEKEAAVRNFIAEHPSGWSGVLPLTHANGTRPVERASSPAARRRAAEAARRTAAEAEIEARERVHRDPCPRCGVRADIGCMHSPTRLGTVL